MVALIARAGRKRLHFEGPHSHYSDVGGPSKREIGPSSFDVMKKMHDDYESKTMGGKNQMIKQGDKLHQKRREGDHPGRANDFSGGNSFDVSRDTFKNGDSPNNGARNTLTDTRKRMVEQSQETDSNSTAGESPAKKRRVLGEISGNKGGKSTERKRPSASDYRDRLEMNEGTLTKDRESAEKNDENRHKWRDRLLLRDPNYKENQGQFPFLIENAVQQIGSTLENGVETTART
ncbi:hypothetical protein [Dictyobacter aurantiacus]|uniref:Uncharacterized protein n=1 Tax=Dictyobacter aurantiacus TaxID=1936993 RepID=A0A401Z9G5_9CHLR|nr:hypothetical protein [Dictyobacter aurantiacus]GCE03482.1 hypothetical protein KDAU_08110 [Dictyobacter aurantiacus]